MAIRSLKSGTFSRSGMVGNPVIMPGSYESIATVTVGSTSQSSITFSSIPSTYTHLQIRLFSKSTQALTDYNYGSVQLNGDTTAANYYQHFLAGDGASATAGGAASQTRVLTEVCNLPASTFGVTILDILDYSNTNKYKTMRSLTGADLNGSGGILLRSSLWSNTAAINSIVLLPASGNYQQYTSAALYGIA